MVRWSAVHWLMVIFCVITQLHSGEVKSELFCHWFMCLQMHTPLWGSHLWKVSKYVNFRNISVSCLQSHSPALRVWIKIQILAVFYNQRYELGPKAVISTCSQVVSIMFSGELSNSNDTPFCLVLKAMRWLFKYIYSWSMWVVLKRTKFLLQARKSLSSLSMYSSC